MRVVSSEIPALAARFWKLVMNFWKLSLKVLSSSQKVFSLASMAALDILSYHILEKSIPLPLLILFRVVMTLILSVE